MLPPICDDTMRATSPAGQLQAAVEISQAAATRKAALHSSIPFVPSTFWWLVQSCTVEWAPGIQFLGCPSFYSEVVVVVRDEQNLVGQFLVGGEF
jgi:hypothetical protein